MDTKKPQLWGSLENLSKQGLQTDIMDGVKKGKFAVKKAGKAAKEGVDKVAEDTINRTARRRKLIDGFKSGQPYTGD